MYVKIVDSGLIALNAHEFLVLVISLLVLADVQFDMHGGDGSVPPKYD